MVTSWKGLLFLLTSIAPGLVLGEICAPSCAVSSEELRELRHSSLYIIDTRSKDDFELARINGSQLIPPNAIKTKSYLQKGPLLLIVDETVLGWGEELCRELTEAGFKGVRTATVKSWVNSGGEVLGSYRRAELTAVKLIKDLPFRKWTLVSETPFPPNLAEFGVEFPFDDALEGRLRELSASGPVAVLKENPLKGELPENVWFLESDAFFSLVKTKPKREIGGGSCR